MNKGRILFTFLLTAAPAVAYADHDSYRYDRYNHRYQWQRVDPDRGSGWGWGSGWNRQYGNNFYHHDYGSSDDAIRRGIQSGRLSRDEVRELRDKEHDLQRERAEYLADGRLSRHEREDLRDDYQDFFGDLNHELNDGERRDRNYRPFYYGR